MVAFADASALVPRYLPEGRTSADDVASPLVVSVLSRVEVPSAIWRKVRTGEVEPVFASAAALRVQVDFRGGPGADPFYQSIAISTEVLDDARDLVARHPLRASDAIQLASAVVTRRRVAECQTLVTYDERLASAAIAEGFDVLPSPADP